MKGCCGAGGDDVPSALTFCERTSVSLGDEGRRSAVGTIKSQEHSVFQMEDTAWEMHRVCSLAVKWTRLGHPGIYTDVREEVRLKSIQLSYRK